MLISYAIKGETFTGNGFVDIPHITGDNFKTSHNSIMAAIRKRHKSLGRHNVSILGYGDASCHSYRLVGEPLDQ